MLCEFAVALGLPLNEWNNNKAMAACASALAASGSTHPVSFVLDRHDKRKGAQEEIRTAAASGGFASAAQ
eukprot:8236661-Alexandrium_andersonii.AAC.1